MTQTEQSLKQAVEEQLDLILRIEEDRKVLKKENKILKEKYREVLSMMKKYSVEKQSVEMKQAQVSVALVGDNKVPLSASLVEGSSNKGLLSFTDVACQVQLEPQYKKLLEAQTFLKSIEATTVVTCIRCQDMARREEVNIKEKDKGQLSGDIVKMAKEISSLKRELKESEGKLKVRQKQLKDLRKCSENTSEALEKSRKQFNELSVLFNGDKYKSVRNLEGELTLCKSKLIKSQEQAKRAGELKQLLEAVTAQYQLFRNSTHP